MSKLKQIFEVEDYKLNDDNIIVTCVKNEQEEILNVNRAKFEKWLTDQTKLNMISDCADYKGDHIQDMTDISVDDYWYEIFIDKRFDLYTYITESGLNPFNKTSDVLGGYFFKELNKQF